MSDLRDQTHPPAVNADHQIFLDYHENSPYAQAKVKSGLKLNPEARVYMENEIAERKLREKLYQDRLAQEKAALNDQQPKPETGAVPSSADVQRDPGPADIRGPDSNSSPNS